MVSILKMDGWKTTNYSSFWGSPIFRGGRGNPSDARQDGLVGSPSAKQMYRALKAVGPGDQRMTLQGRIRFSHQLPRWGSWENHRRAKVPKKRGDMYGYPGGYAALNFCCCTYLSPT